MKINLSIDFTSFLYGVVAWQVFYMLSMDRESSGFTFTLAFFAIMVCGYMIIKLIECATMS